ncbi:Wzz/FepE/Etk N-terminal domain-containing protein [Fictibacillus sp. b24]|uniref:Wzz/FepE/Etk N-terminal domain-containing protein n=1 Tax=Fictibacillus sp. b24 TaxID=3055863 RepID=UPI0025A02C07|nr:Wzz/FepE/Etk N-terminal domain-containing protein [Fictibacillus sp. b24]MDM5315051.1 Wzz/FepE/Etk N-terminal domain-containing protein [Fictibacillus sp. b24]
MHEEKRYVLYDYLVFFWNKKWWFLLLPLITLGLAFLFSMMQPVEYQGRTIIYTGDLKGSETDPEVIKHLYKDDVEGNNLSVEVFERGQLVFTVTGNNSEQVSDVISSISKKHINVLNEKYNKRILSTKEKMQRKEKHIESLNKLTDVYGQRLNEDTLSPEEESRMTELQLASIELEQQIDNNKKDIEFFEKPQQLDTTVTESSRNQKPILALGLVLGLFLSLVSLILWKYIEDARRYRRND